MRKAVIVIPARWGSTRFPGKPLAMVAGKSLISRVWENAGRVKNAESIWIATDDQRILNHCQKFTSQVVLTDANCRNGTERVWDAVSRLKLSADIYVNYQGDAPLVPSHVLESLIEEMIQNQNLAMATPAVGMSPKEMEEAIRLQNQGNPGIVTVVFSQERNALYFSRFPIPFVKNKSQNIFSQKSMLFAAYRHIGVYAYRAATLKRLAESPLGKLEQLEELEQLRALEYGIAIRVIEVDYKGRSEWELNTQEDVAIIENLIKMQGEL